MDLEQIIKRLEWLDEERRKDKTTIATLEDRLKNFESNIPGLSQRINALESELTRVNSLLSRFDQIEANVAQIRVEFARQIDAVEKQRVERERESDKVRRADVDQVNRSVAEVRKSVEPIPELRKTIQARQEEEFRLARLIDELENKFTEATRSEEDYRRTIKLLDEGRRQDTKKLTDIQSEVSALRKRSDEQRGKVDLTADSIRKVELRVTEVLAAESERRQQQSIFIDKQNMITVERDRLWKEWQTRFDDILRQATNLDAQMQSLEGTHRAVKRAQEAFDEITQKFERRVNEITEMQRLTEERFRQEWVTFKADDQKRWTNYTLGQDEQQRETNRQFERYTDRLVALEDVTQEAHDSIEQLMSETQKRLHALLTVAHQSVEEYERTFGRAR